ncbi:hypothetical protein P13BB106kb_p125 [Pectobacterium phage DU_PP_V]|uniref:Uncharacterized protein n=1 Tax=Pectobacterium phage DU_PP_V TaxID=2041492 RepID=A0A2D2W736_9CAUD|nr:terminase small subunit [Pectobacterium phage DU_PP_V]ATS94109.1 hypothetical protein P13BB106kb_p125 [Pectobacterium phage DU_PP_V]
MANDLLVPDLMSPEGMEVIDAYIANGSDVPATARFLGITEVQCRMMLQKPEVKNYINTLFMESGYRNRDKLFGVLDEIIDRKVSTLRDNPEYGSDQDIMDILWKAHKMKMEEMKMLIQLEEAKSKNAGTQNNTQNNIILGSNDVNYVELIESITRGGK